MDKPVLEHGVLSTAGRMVHGEVAHFAVFSYEKSGLAVEM
jgi:hypothetical protein